MEEERANLITNEPTTTQYDPTLPLFVPDPQYNSADLSCSNTYCHGYFKNGNLTNTPVWTDASTSLCGSCHGSGTNPLPKTSAEEGTHPNDMNCVNCHSGVVDANQNIINPSKHIDGKLNLFGNDIDF
jgi:predicted CxxxxCH...CXXCH cytochrome family protein